jgi:hypothetical protein
MNQQEQKLIEAIKAKPGYQVFPGSMGGSVIVACTKPTGTSQQSVWLGRRSTIENLERIAAADKVIVHMGDTWRVIGIGAKRNGNTFCHLASTHRGNKQKNGWMPAQINDWVDNAVLQEAK